MGIFLGDPWQDMRQQGQSAPQQGGLGIGGFLRSDNGSNLLQALGASLMSSPGYAPLSNFPSLLAGYQAQSAQKRASAKEEEKANRTLEYIRSNFPDIGKMVDAGLPVGEAFKMVIDSQKPQKRNLMSAGDGYFLDGDTGQWIASPAAGKTNDYSQREAAAAQYGLEPGSPAYQAFILTGKMPREDQAPLTATDKKAILESDDMVAANENAIYALDQAEKLSDQANSGWFAGSRAAIGNNLPDVMVPDFVSSPQSSQATTDMDNAVVGQALSSLKTIFGGNPTEGERKILLDLQGSSSMPVAVRKEVFKRAKEMAQRRLEFNRQRAAGLRGGDYYKPGAGSAAPGGQRTSSGIEWSIEP